MRNHKQKKGRLENIHHNYQRDRRRFFYSVIRLELEN
jgi:hypothetical protein